MCGPTPPSNEEIAKKQKNGAVKLNGKASTTNDRVADPSVWLKIADLSQPEWKELSTSKNPDIRRDQFQSVDTLTKEKVLEQTPITWFQELAVILFLAIGPPNGAIFFPIVLTLIGYFIVGNIGRTFLAFGLGVLLPLTLMPRQKFHPSYLYSWMAHSVAQYFSCTFLGEGWFHTQDPTRPRILVAPPHGVFPYGNMLAIVAWPLLSGFTIRGLASSAALRVPIFSQILRSVGVVDASRPVATKCLKEGKTIGISTGGVAEIFYTNDKDECVVLRERKGLVKLALRTGAELVPCYLFGNTKLLGCWTGEGLPGWMRAQQEYWSRRWGFAIIYIMGRFGLPIPYRKPIFGVSGVPIPTKHLQCADPSPEVVDELHEELLTAMVELFDKHKHLYGWEDKNLIIK